MDYEIKDIGAKLSGSISKNEGGGDYAILLDGKERQLRILGMDARGIEFILDKQYHTAKYLGHSTGETSLIIDNVPVTLNTHSHFDGIVFKNSGGSAASAQVSLKSQIPGKVVSIAVAEGSEVKEGDIICTLESMKMQVGVKAHKAGTVRSLKVKEGATVAKGDIMAEIE